MIDLYPDFLCTNTRAKRINRYPSTLSGTAMPVGSPGVPSLRCGEPAGFGVPEHVVTAHRLLSRAETTAPGVVPGAPTSPGSTDRDGLRAGRGSDGGSVNLDPSPRGDRAGVA